MKIKCPKCKTSIEVNPAAMMGSITSNAKAKAARLNAKWPRKRKLSGEVLDGDYKRKGKGKI